MFSRKYKKQNKLIKFILKFFNLYAYEKETLNMVNPNYKNVGKNFIKFNDTSFNFNVTSPFISSPKTRFIPC